MNTPARVPWTRSHCVLGFHAKRSAIISGVGFCGAAVRGTSKSFLSWADDGNNRCSLFGHLIICPVTRDHLVPTDDHAQWLGQFSDTAFFTSAAILASSAAVNPFSA